MPTLSMFYGIIVRMHNEKGEKHHQPHIHCTHGEDEIVLSLDGTILEGAISKSKLKLLEAWVILHKDELYANWILLSNGEGFFKIEPLR